MKCQCQVLGIHWFDIISNVDVQAHTGLTPLSKLLAARCISVFGHSVWLESDVPAHMAPHKHINLSVTRLSGPDRN